MAQVAPVIILSQPTASPTPVLTETVKTQVVEQKIDDKINAKPASPWTILVFVVLIVLTSICGFLTAKSAIEIKNNGYEENEDLKKVHAFSAGCASIAFILAIVIAACAGLVIIRHRSDSKLFGMMIALLCATLGVLGGLSAAAAVQLERYRNTYGSDDLLKSAHAGLVWSSVLAFLGLSILAISAIVYKKHKKVVNETIEKYYVQ